jgi:hypothetical protein
MKNPGNGASLKLAESLRDYERKHPKPEPMRLSDLRTLILEQSREAQEMAAPIKYEPRMSIGSMN